MKVLVEFLTPVRPYSADFCSSGTVTYCIILLLLKFVFYHDFRGMAAHTGVKSDSLVVVWGET
jgi:hypothetical protein